MLREFNLHPLWMPRVLAAEISLTPVSAALIPPSVTVEIAQLAEVITAEEVREIAAPIEAITDAADNWQVLNNQVVTCKSCALHSNCPTPLLGAQTQADWLFISEAQGADEGENSVLLSAMLSAMQLQRGQNVAVVSALKCSLLNHRAPSAEQVAQCAPFLQRQIALTQPKLIVALGKTAAMALLATVENLGSLRGRCHDYRGIPLIVTYHPAYLLRMPAEKAHAWQDLKLALQTMQLSKGST